MNELDWPLPRLTTAEITYHRPDHPSILQQYIWQELDLSPHYPILRKFLHFWVMDLDGRSHSVKVASVGFTGPPRFVVADGQFLIH